MMMTPPDDIALLDAWRQHGDRDAIDRLVRRYVDAVYAAARRQVADAHLAEDVTQAVFMLLVSKSPHVRDPAALAVWLHRTTRFASANARRMRQRRLRREERASARMSMSVNSDDAVRAVDDADEHAALLPVLDEAIARLSPRERDGVILCYFHQCTYRQLGAMLGVTEEAARKRVARAVEQMRSFFAQRGVAVSAAAVASCLTAQSAVAAPVGLVSAAANVVAFTQIAATASSSGAIVKGVIQAMFITKIKLATAACVAVVACGALTATAIQQAGTATEREAAAQVASAVAAAPDGPTFKISPAENVELEFLGVAPWPATGKEWFALDGSKIDFAGSPFDDLQFRPDNEPTHQVLMRITGSDHPGFAVNVPESSKCLTFDVDGSHQKEQYLLAAFTPAEGKKAADLELSFAFGEWQLLCEVENEIGRPPPQQSTPSGGVSFTHVMEAPNGGSLVYVAHDIREQSWMVFCTDDRGTPHMVDNIRGGAVGAFQTYVLEFRHLPPEQIATLQFRTRRLDTQVTVKNVALDPSRPTKPQIAITKPDAERN